jgi:hypothetical protein
MHRVILVNIRGEIIFADFKSIKDFVTWAGKEISEDDLRGQAHRLAVNMACFFGVLLATHELEFPDDDIEVNREKRRRGTDVKFRFRKLCNSHYFEHFDIEKAQADFNRIVQEWECK